MSHYRSSFATSRIKKTFGRRRIDNGQMSPADMYMSNHSRSPERITDRSVRERALKQVGLTSTTFIGPAFPPPKPKKVKSAVEDALPKKVKSGIVDSLPKKAKSGIEDSLSEFYKELEKIDAPDGAQPPIPLKTSTGRQTRNASEEKGFYTSGCGGSEGYQGSGGQKQPSWSHWYPNEPYYHRRQGPDGPAQNQWHDPQTSNRPPNLRFHRPPLHGPPFPNPQNPPSSTNPNWSGSAQTNQYQEAPHFPKCSSFPPPAVSGHPSQGFYGDSPYHFDRDERVCGFDAHSDNVNVGWPRAREEESCHFVEDYDRSKRYDSENEPWDHDYRPPANANAFQTSLDLILMRGLPGSGKSTLARERLSAHPNGLILSTDDYFAYRDGYRYEPDQLGAAHEWNVNRARDAMQAGRSPIIIDNTNVQAWEMKPYVKMGLEKGYKVDFCEPDTSWKCDPYELERRNKHSVPQEKIAQMMARFSLPISVDIVMRSQEPAHVSERPEPEQPVPPVMRENPKE